MITLAIDPGPKESAWVTVDPATFRPLRFAKEPNWTVRARIGFVGETRRVIEMIASYGMPVGAEVFETCMWIGRFVDMGWQKPPYGVEPDLIPRKQVALHHCNSGRANDANVTQALVDRFAPGQSNHGKGTKKEPGWFYGFSGDVWQAYALAVYAIDTEQRKTA